jgi:hypothetical protein
VALLDLIDHPLRGADEAAIVQLLLEEGIHAEELVGIALDARAVMCSSS